MVSISERELAFLEDKAKELREDVIKALIEAGSGHSAGSLGTADIFAALYFNVLNHDPKNPNLETRDRFVLSNAHICPILYTTLAHSGYFPKEELMTLRKLGTRLHGHPHVGTLPGIEASGGPLGQGISIAVGMAVAARMDGKKHRVYCMLGDGEQDEGQVWEALMFAGKEKLNNLTVVVDRNNIQIDGFTEDVMPLEPLKEKYEAFGWYVIDVDGHNIRHLIDAFEEAKAIYEKPTIIIAHTIAGKGIDWMEYDYRWHGAPPGKGPEDVVKHEKQAEEALKKLHEIRTLSGKIKGEHE